MALRLKFRASKKVGLKPGAVVYVGEKRTHEITFKIADYTDTEYTETHYENVEDCFPYLESKTNTWINVNGIHDAELIEKLGHHFKVHDLILEDLVNTGHRPKFEETDGYLFVVLKLLRYNEETGHIDSEQISILSGKTIVLSFQETEGDQLGEVRARLKKTVPRRRFIYADYLAYTLMDAIVDRYFVVLEHIGERVEALEDELIDHPLPEHLEQIRSLKKEMMAMRRALWPLREVVSAFERTESDMVSDITKPYLRDLYEHVIQVIDTVEQYRDTVSSLQDIYLSSISNRMNEVMKVLTIIATIFIPLGFLAGVYGMNFNTEASAFNLPELDMKYGYIGFWTIVLLVGGGLFWFFKRKKWL